MPKPCRVITEKSAFIVFLTWREYCAVCHNVVSYCDNILLITGLIFNVSVNLNIMAVSPLGLVWALQASLISAFLDTAIGAELSLHCSFPK